ncbi:MAG: hypothetical protein JSR67_13600 [Proteobacteria bacterium]|nr:hypothetical protein [Pseudomonadota bacterium]
MKKKILCLLSGAIFGLLPVAGVSAGEGATAPQIMTAGDLQQLCAGTDHVSRNVCRVYILGVTEGIVLGLALADRHQARPCLPASLSAESLEDAVRHRLSGTLADADSGRDAARYIQRVLVTEYRCGAGPRGAPR